MIKHYILLILLVSVSYVHTQQSACEDGQSASSVDDCINKIGQSYKNSGYHCCLQKGKKNGREESMCKYLTEEDYKDVDDYIGDLEDGYNDVTVNCKSYYLQIGILSLLLFLL